jgi:signal transduction histidine kinase
MAEAGVGRAEMTDVDIVEIGRDAFELYEPLAEEKGQRLSFVAEGQAVVRGQRQLLAQAVANLLDNAVKYSPAASVVCLEVKKDADRIYLCVSDNGPGVLAKDRERVLGRFVRLDASRSTPGSGLGLSLVAAVAKLHGAALSLEDNAPGLRVSLAFPAREEFV